MAVYYKFKSAKDYHSIPIDGPFISIFNLKERLFDSKRLGKGKDFDLVVTNAQTNEEYLDEGMLIPKNISVLIRRVPGLPCKPIVTQPDKPEAEKVEYLQPVKSNAKAASSSGFLHSEALEWEDEFGSLYPSIPEVTLRPSNNPVPDSVASNKSDEDSKIKALVEGAGFMQQNNNSHGPGPWRKGGRGGRIFGPGALECKTPPQGYVCHRCKVAGHFIQHCPTNGDPDYDIKKVRPPTGIPKSMRVQLDDTYALPTGAASVLQPNEAAFEKEMEGLTSTRCLGNLPPELRCPLCREVMKDAVLTRKCCFGSFCDKCIRDNIISKSMCFCGARDILADDLVPNMTLRGTINHILESGSSSSKNSGSGLRVQDKASARSQTRTSSPTQSAASKENQMLPPGAKETSNSKENLDGGKHSNAPQQQVRTSGEGKITKVPYVARESATVKEQDSAVPVQEKMQQKVAAVEAGKKKKRKKIPFPENAADIEWMGMQPFVDGYMDPSAFNPWWPGMQPAVNEFVSPFGGSMGYGLGPFGNFIPSDPYASEGFSMAAMLPPLQTDFPQSHGYYGREASSSAKASSVNLKHKLAPNHRSLSDEVNYNRYNGYDHYHRTEHTSHDYNQVQHQYHDRFKHHRATSQDPDVLCKKRKVECM